MNEAFSGLFFSMGVAVLIVYVAMVLTFNSLVTPFIILFSLPLATIGALPALFLTGRPLGVSALIGFLMLIGIVVTNAIVLLDLVERLRSQGMSTHDALIEGGRTRVRPILMTAIATILALIPLAAGFNQGSIIAAELGTVVIGGLFSSTFLTLLVIPVDLLARRRASGRGPPGARGRPLGRGTRPRRRRRPTPLARAGRTGARSGVTRGTLGTRGRTRPPAHALPPEESDRWRSPATPKSPGTGACSRAPGTINYVSSGAIQPPARDLGLADRGPQRPDVARGAPRRGARIVLLDGVLRAAREERHRGHAARHEGRRDVRQGRRRLEHREEHAHRKRHVPGIDQAKFAELAEAAKDGCPVSRALAADVEVAVEATLVG